MKGGGIVFIFSLWLVFFGCSESKETRLKILAEYYVDILFIDEKYAGMEDSLKIHKQKLFERYDITEEQYREDLKNIKQNPETWKNFYSEVEKILNERKAQTANS